MPFEIARARRVPRSRASGDARAVQQVAPRAKGPFHPEQIARSETPRRDRSPRLRTPGPWASARGNGKAKSNKRAALPPPRACPRNYR